LRCLLALDGRKGTNASLPLQRQQPLIKATAQEHDAVHVPELILIKIGHELGIHPTMLIKDREVRNMVRDFYSFSGHKHSSPSTKEGKKCAIAGVGMHQVRSPTTALAQACFWSSPEVGLRGSCIVHLSN
jgi:hypothetical protein